MPNRALATLLLLFRFAQLAGLPWSEAASAASGFHEIRDGRGHAVRLTLHPARIVTLTPSLGEIAAKLCGSKPDRIVGVSVYSDFPAALSRVPSVASMSNLNLEAIVALKPDLVLSQQDANPGQQVARLRELGLPVVVTQSGTLEEIEKTIQLVGVAMGEEPVAVAITREMERKLSLVKARAKARQAAGTAPLKVLLELDQDPLIVVGGKSFINNELDTVGARNTYRDSGLEYPRPAMEDVLRRDPDRILIVGNSKRLDYARGLAKSWQRFPSLKAVHEKAIRVLEADTIVRPGPRIVDGIMLIEQAIYGDVQKR